MKTAKKNEALFLMQEALSSSKELIKDANRIDLDNSKKKGKNQAFLDRLELTDRRIEDMCQMFKDVIALEDPIGKILEKKVRPNGLIINKVRVPIGVIGIIYESRPNVTADCISLCFKSGNAVILRGGSDSINTNKAIYDVLKKSISELSFPEGVFTLIEDTSRVLVDEMLKARGDIDLIMPRGGESLIEEVVNKSKIPVIKHYKGICHIYVDKDADLSMARDICINAKVQRPGVCNAMETMLVHNEIAGKFLPEIAAQLNNFGVKIKGCDRTVNLLGALASPVTVQDYYTEWLDLVLNIRIVDSLDEAVSHINKYGSKHSDAIVTKNENAGREFCARVDTSSVYVNASTRFTDGAEFGLGAEIGISTDKIHARGPMGLNELTTYKYVIRGTGQIRN